MTTKEDEMLTVQDAARETGLSEDTIYAAIYRGRLTATTKYGRKVISRQALKAWKDNPELHRRGNPNFRG